MQEHVLFPADSSQEDSYYSDKSQHSPKMSISTADSSPASRNPHFDPSACLFCPQTNPSLAENLSHMCTSHSFHIQTTNLLVETTTLLAHFHSVINDCFECLYCRKSLRSSEAVKQHMLHKGHCMYDVASGEDAVVKGYYGFDAAEAELEGVKAELTARLADLRISRQEVAASMRQDRKKRDAESRSAEASVRDSESRVSHDDDDSRLATEATTPATTTTMTRTSTEIPQRHLHLPNNSPHRPSPERKHEPSTSLLHSNPNSRVSVRATARAYSIYRLHNSELCWRLSINRWRKAEGRRARRGVL